MARSASWSCPSSVDLASTLTGWHTGWWDLFALIFLVSLFCIRSVTSHVWCIKTMFTRIIALRLICTVRFSQKIFSNYSLSFWNKFCIVRYAGRVALVERHRSTRYRPFTLLHTHLLVRIWPRCTQEAPNGLGKANQRGGVA